LGRIIVGTLPASHGSNWHFSDEVVASPTGQLLGEKLTLRDRGLKTPGAARLRAIRLPPCKDHVLQTPENFG